MQPLNFREKLQSLGPLLLALLRALMAAQYVTTLGCTTVVFQRKASEPRPLLLALRRARMAALHVMTFREKTSEPRPTAADLTPGTDGSVVWIHLAEPPLCFREKLQSRVPLQLTLLRALMAAQ